MQLSPDNILDQRRAGVLLHITSLPGRFDGGVLGAEARKFVNYLSEAGFSVWQTLPLGPVDRTFSPYSLRSADAGNPRLIDLGLYTEEPWRPSEAELDDAQTWPARAELLVRTCDRFFRHASGWERKLFFGFVRKEYFWLGPFSLYEALKSLHAESPWWEWPERFRLRDPTAVSSVRREAKRRIREIMFEQFLFAEQWQALKRHANERGIYIFGDMPFYVDRDSVEVWWRRELFQVNSEGWPAVVSGVPPDYFAADGQLWRHPIYDWERMRRDGYRWWVDRIRHQLARFDLLRIDHFRAFESYWEIPGDATSARTGRWARGPGTALLETLARQSMTSRLVAEDLGMITPSVRMLRDQFHLPGILVLQFAFDGSDDNAFLPENHREHAVVYTGTHDNDTTEGWYRSLPPEVRARVCRRLQTLDGRIREAMIAAAFESVARLAVVPLQDLLGLGSGHRMNTPGTREGNWRWRFSWEDLGPQLSSGLRQQIRTCGRD